LGKISKGPHGESKTQELDFQVQGKGSSQALQEEISSEKVKEEVCQEASFQVQVTEKVIEKIQVQIQEASKVIEEEALQES
jgi:nitrogen regulatory protein PII